MKVIIPIAGKGTRMRPLTHTTAKPLIPVAGKPVLDHVLERLKDLDISEYIFITGYLKEQLEEYITDKYDFKMRFVEQPVQDGTAGACKMAEPYVDEPVLIVFVDTIFDADLSIIKNCENDGIIWAKEVEDYQRFGVIVQDKDGFITNIVEKPDKPISKLANIGVYYIKDYKQFYDGIKYVYDKNLKVKGEYFLPEAFMYMIKQGAKLTVAPVTGWYDCGKPETTLESNAALLKHELKSQPKNTTINEPVFIDEGCTIEDCDLGPNVSISKGCTITNAKLMNCILGKDCTVANASLHDSLLGEHVVVEGKNNEFQLSLGDHSRVE